MSITATGVDGVGRALGWQATCDVCGADLEDYSTPGPEERRMAVVKSDLHVGFEEMNFFIHFSSSDSHSKPRDLCGRCILTCLEQTVRALAKGKVRYERDLRRV